MIVPRLIFFKTIVYNMAVFFAQSLLVATTNLEYSELSCLYSHHQTENCPPWVNLTQTTLSAEIIK